MAIATLSGNKQELFTKQKGATAIQRVKVRTMQEIINNGKAILGPIKDRIVETVRGVMSWMNLSSSFPTARTFWYLDFLFVRSYLWCARG